MPEYKKQETVNAVYLALEILNEREKQRRQCWSETWKSTKYGTTHKITMINRCCRFLDIYISLIVGRSQQRRLKRYARQYDIRLKSWIIAQETGASFEEVEELFLTHMSHYVEPKQ